MVELGPGAVLVWPIAAAAAAAALVAAAASSSCDQKAVPAAAPGMGAAAAAAPPAAAAVWPISTAAAAAASKTGDQKSASLAKSALAASMPKVKAISLSGWVDAPKSKETSPTKGNEDAKTKAAATTKPVSSAVALVETKGDAKVSILAVSCSLVPKRCSSLLPIDQHIECQICSGDVHVRRTFACCLVLCAESADACRTTSSARTARSSTARSA